MTEKKRMTTEEQIALMDKFVGLGYMTKTFDDAGNPTWSWTERGLRELSGADIEQVNAQ